MCFVTIPTYHRPPICDKLVSVGEIRIDCDDVLKYLAPAWCHWGDTSLTASSEEKYSGLEPRQSQREVRATPSVGKVRITRTSDDDWWREPC